MPRYKRVDMSPRLLAVDLSRQVLPGSFEFALTRLIDHHLSLSAFESRFRNDQVGAPAYPPAVLLKIVLLAYSKGLIHSRDIEAACRENVVFMAVSGDSHPHFTTIAHFVSASAEAIAQLFTQVLMVCQRQGLVGREMFAIDGVKLPSNASKAKSGTRADFLREAAKMRAQVRKMIERHRSRDQCDTAEEPREREARHSERLAREAERIQRWLEDNPQDRRGANNNVRQSNRTDNESAKMATEKGVIQGYTAVAAVDDKHQIIVQAQAHGVGQEQELLLPMVEALQPMLGEHSVIGADAGYYSKLNVEALEERALRACIPDPNYRSRDPRYAGQQRHKDKPDALWDKRKRPKANALFRPEQFSVAEDFSHCICPAGKRLYRNGRHHNLRGFEALKFTGTKRDCTHCPLRSRCLRHPELTPVRQVAIFLRKVIVEHAVERMKKLVDSEPGKRLIAQRFATVEPVFANLRFNKALNRFTLRGRHKVDGQWKLYCLVHNIEKLANNGYPG
jgi:transposase